MKANKIFAAAAMVAMFTMNAVQAMADKYHAQKVECRMGVSSKTVSLKYIGDSAIDGSEIWAAENNTDNTAYFWCNIDGNDFSVPVTNIDGNQTHTLEDISWYEMPLLRKLPSENKQTLFVKVDGKDSKENRFMAWDQKEVLPDENGNCVWWIKNIVSIECVGEPVYNAEVDSFTQKVRWHMSGINDELFKETFIYCSVDGGDYWVYRAHFTAENMAYEADIVFPGKSERVMFAVEVNPKDCYAGLVNNIGKWTRRTPEKSVQRPSNAKQKAFADEETTTTSGIDNAFDNSQANAPVDIYNISGQRVSQGVSLKEASASLTRGIYVVNGKKMMLGK